MKKSEVYSWRVDPQVKGALEHEARREGRSVGSLLEQITIEWLAAKRRASGGDADEQVHLHEAAAKTFGTLAGGNPDRSTSVRAAVRKHLTESRGRQRAD